jgi:hypothetical protein
MFENDSLRFTNLQKDSTIFEISEEKLYFSTQLDEMYDELEFKNKEIDSLSKKK